MIVKYCLCLKCGMQTLVSVNNSPLSRSGEFATQTTVLHLNDMVTAVTLTLALALATASALKAKFDAIANSLIETKVVSGLEATIMVCASALALLYRSIGLNVLWIEIALGSVSNGRRIFSKTGDSIV